MRVRTIRLEVVVHYDREAMTKEDRQDIAFAFERRVSDALRNVDGIEKAEVKTVQQVAP